MKFTTIHTQIAAAIAKIGEVTISESWKQTANQTRKDRAIVIPMECVKAPDAPEQFRPLIESVLMTAAKMVLKAHVNESPNNFQISLESFERPALMDFFLASSDSWMTKENLEKAFTASATWARIVGREKFKSDAVYQANANGFKADILKLAAKPTHLAEERRTKILSVLDENDLDSDLGVFIQRRFDMMAKKDNEATYSADDL